ncbi:MAG TPA: VIT1/CCC1 transporter family protein [Chloroflexota bacterium]|nr:VIT1/CCC1 transporter family protein [Chloroflexota bacterium]
MPELTSVPRRSEPLASVPAGPAPPPPVRRLDSEALARRTSRREPAGAAILRGERWHEPLGRVLREIVFGMNDGLISQLTLVAGVSGALDQPGPIVVAGLAALVAGSVSMAIGGYLSVKAQQEFYASEIRRELYEMETMPEHEREEVRQLYRAKGLEGPELERVVAAITANRDVWLKVMMEEELGLFPEHDPRPVVSAAYTGASFALGALVPLLPYLFLPPLLALGVAIVLAAATLFGIGASKARLTRRHWLPSGLEIMSLGLLAAAVGYGIGWAVGQVVPEVGPLH